MNSENENFSFLASLRSNYDELLKEIRENPEIIGKQSFRLDVAGLLGGLKIAKEIKMNLAEIGPIQTGVQEILKKFPEDIRAKIKQFLQDPKIEPQINHLVQKGKHVPPWMRSPN